MVPDKLYSELTIDRIYQEGTKTDCPDFGQGTERTYNYAVPTPPFTWAIPMLTGWDIGTPCDDQHLRKAGVWIEDFHYEHVPGAGILHYTVRTTYSDKDDYPGMWDRVQIDVLGINLLQPVLDPGTNPGTNPGSKPGLTPGGGVLDPGNGGFAS